MIHANWTILRFADGEERTYLIRDALSGEAFCVQPRLAVFGEVLSAAQNLGIKTLGLFPSSDQNLRSEDFKIYQSRFLTLHEPKTEIRSEPGLLKIGALFFSDSPEKRPAALTALDPETVIYFFKDPREVLFLKFKHWGRDLSEIEGKPLSLSVDKFHQRLKQGLGDDLILDVRESSEYALAHIDGATQLNPCEVGAVLEQLKPYKKIYIYCFTGRTSQFVAQALARVCAHDVIHITGGFRQWQNQGLPLV